MDAPRTRFTRTPATLALVALALAACGDAGAGQPRTKQMQPAGCAPGQRLVVAAPPDGRSYLGAFPFLGNTEDQVSRMRIASFEQTAGHELAWTYFSDNWGDGIRFPAAAVRTIRASGSTPFIRMMPRSDFDEGQRDERWSTGSIATGRHDVALRAWMRRAARVDGPMLVEFGAEANGDWFPWNGRWNGGGERTRYGDPRWPDGPERFRDAFRRVVRLSREAGASNVTWVFHVDATPDPDVWWNQARWYWPGDRWVDWLGLSAYGSQSPNEPVEPIDSQLDRGYRDVAALSRRAPIALLETGVSAAPGRDTGSWTRDAFATIASGRYPRLRGVAWWHERWTSDDGSVSDLRIDSTAAQLRAYRSATAGGRYVTQLRTACR